MAGKFTTLVDMIDNSLRSFGPNRAFGTKKNGTYTWITYADFGEQIGSFRGGLVSAGVKSGDRVAIIANNRYEWAVACYASSQLGAAIVPMYESQTVEDWLYILQDATPTVLVVSKPELFAKVRPAAQAVSSIKEIVLLDANAESATFYPDFLARGKSVKSTIASVTSGQLASLIYTSGTTGKPKGVMLSHANIISNINAIHAILPFEQTDVSLSFLPWAHSFGQVCELHGLISCGSALGLAERTDTIIDNLSEVHPTLLFSVPRIFNKIYDGLHKKMANESNLKRKLFYAGLANAKLLREKVDRGEAPGLTGLANKFYDKLVFSKVRQRLGGKLKYAFSGGAALSKEVAEFIDSLNITVYEGYGLSETSPIMTCNAPGARRIGSVGKPIPGVTVKIDTSVASGDPGVGEIINHGPNTMMGYFNRPEETAAVMTPEKGFRTGDLGRFDKDGFLFITGRVKEQYKLENGKYVAPAPLEEKLQLSPYISQCMIYGDNKLFNIAVIVPDFVSVREWAEKTGVPAGTNSELIANDLVRELIKVEIDKFSSDWKSFERPRNFLLLPEEWTVENDMLTPSLKLKRRNVMRVAGDAIQQVYTQAPIIKPGGHAAE